MPHPFPYVSPIFLEGGEGEKVMPVEHIRMGIMVIMVIAQQ